MSATARRRTKRSKGWVPDQHGAWVMVVVPALVGVGLAPAGVDIPLLITWWAGYFAFFAAGILVRSRFREINRPPVYVYGAITIAAGLICLAVNWRFLYWIPAFAPWVLIAIWELWKRRPRSLASGWSTVIAACLMTPLGAWAGGHDLDLRVWAVTAVLTAYFLGTVPYVKTLIRERGDARWLWFSVGFHVAVTLIAVAAAFSGVVSRLVPLVFCFTTLRAFTMPFSGQRRQRPWTPKTVGLIEGVVTVLVVIAALVQA